MLNCETHKFKFKYDKTPAAKSTPLKGGVASGRLPDLWTSLTSCVCSSRSLLGSKWSQMRFWLVRTATPLHTHSEQSTSRIYNRETEAGRVHQ